MNNMGGYYPPPLRPRDVIVSFASNGREDYRKSLLRLLDSCAKHWRGDVLVYSPDHWVETYRGYTIHKGYPKPKAIKSFTHQEMPYQFKTAMIQLAVEQGYERVWWLDSSMQLVRSLEPLMETFKVFSPGGYTGQVDVDPVIEDRSIITFHNLGHPTYKYLSDNAKWLLNSYFDTNKTLKEIPQIWGGAFMLDFTKENARNFFEMLKLFSLNGSFKDGPGTDPEFVAHRHDQSVMSVILSRYKHTMLPYGNILCPPHDRTGEYGLSHYLLCRGL